MTEFMFFIFVVSTALAFITSGPTSAFFAGAAIGTLISLVDND